MGPCYQRKFSQWLQWATELGDIMGYYLGNQNIIDNYRDLAPGRITNRASLPTGSAGYLAYLSDQNDLVIGGASENQAPDVNITWYKFRMKPMDYKNEVLLNQGVLGGGGQNIPDNDRNTMQQVLYNTDSLIKLTATLPFTTAYGGGHSTKLLAYYHQGRDALATSYNGYGAVKHDWISYTQVYLNNRPNCQGANINTLQPGPVTQNTYGIVLKDSASCYIQFSTDTWTSGGYDAPNGTGLGWATFSQYYGYNYSGSGDLYRLDFNSSAWSATGAGGPPSGGSAPRAGKVLNTKWGKFYTGGLNYDKYTEASNSWSVALNRNVPVDYDNQYQSTLMAQDWGYWCGYLDAGHGSAIFDKFTYIHHYATDTIFHLSFMDISYPTVAASATTGP